MSDTELERKELAARIATLLEATKRPSVYTELGASMARDIDMMMWSPRLNVLRWSFFCKALQTGDEDATNRADQDYENSCQAFAKRFSLEEMWAHTHSFDRPEYRRQLVDKELPVTLTNLARAAIARIESEKETP